MKNVKFLTKNALRLGALRWCVLLAAIAFAVPSVLADDFYVQGDMTSWDSNSLGSSAKMTASGTTYTWSYTPTSSGDVYFRVLGKASNGWYSNGLGPSSNGTSLTETAQSCIWTSSNAWKWTVTAGTTYTLIFDQSALTVKYSVDGGSKTTATYYLTGADGLGLSWAYAPTTTMTYDEDNDYYTYTYNVTTAGEYGFVFGSAQGSSWDDFNGNYRIGPTGGDVTVTLNGDWASTQKAGGDNGAYMVTVGVGTVTIYYDATNNKYKVTGTEPEEPSANEYTFYVRCTDGSVPYLYAWNTSDKSELPFGEWNGTQGTTTETINGYKYYKFTCTTTASQLGVIASNSSGSQTKDLTTTAGEYTYYITWDTSSKESATISTEPDGEANEYIFYVRLDGISTANIYVWDADENKLAGDWPGTTLSTLDVETINGYTYYKLTCSTTASALNVILNQGTGTQTENITGLTPGTYFFTYKGGSSYTKDTKADGESGETSTGMYVIGRIGSQSWAANAGTAMTKVSDGVWTLENVVMTVGSTIGFATQLGSYSEDWATLNEYRFRPKESDGEFWVTDEYLGQALPYRAYNTSGTSGENWYISATGTYTITVNTNDGTVTFTRTASGDKIYMVGNYIYNGTNYSYNANEGVEMTTLDGKTYILNNVSISNDLHFCFAATLGSSATDWDGLADRKGGMAGAEYKYIYDTDINQALPLYTWNQDASGNCNEFVMKANGTYNVIVDTENQTVRLVKVSTGLTTLNIYLKATDNVAGVGNDNGGNNTTNNQLGLQVFNKDKAGSNWGNVAYYIDNGSGELANGTTYMSYPYSYLGTVEEGGYTWYHWEVQNAIADFYFVRSGSPKCSEYVLRRSGECWLEWASDSTNNWYFNDLSRQYFTEVGHVSSVEQMMEGHYYAYFINTIGWSDVYCYAWNNAQNVAEGSYTVRENGTWPGGACQLVGYDDDGYQIWVYDFGTIEELGEDWVVPEGIIFNAGGEEDGTTPQTGDFVYRNGGVYDYLGRCEKSYTLNDLIRTAPLGVEYIISNKLQAVYYDENAMTPIFDTKGRYMGNAYGALYLKDLDEYPEGERSENPGNYVEKDADGTHYIAHRDYVYQTCALPEDSVGKYPGKSQIQLYRTEYDQSNWIKVVPSPNYVTITSSKHGFLGQQGFEGNGTWKDNGSGVVNKWVGKAIDTETLKNWAVWAKNSAVTGAVFPANTIYGAITDSINPQFHFVDIDLTPNSDTYNPNVYITTHFKDSVVYQYTPDHKDWLPREDGKLVDNHWFYRTTPNPNTEYTDSIYYLYYVAPKPQEVCLITWATYDNDADMAGSSQVDEPYYNGVPSPGAFYAPLNSANRDDRYHSEDGTTGTYWPGDTAAHGGTGLYDNGFNQWGGFLVNWSLFGEGDDYTEQGVSSYDGDPWYKIFQKNQQYKIAAIVRYGKDAAGNIQYEPGIWNSNVDTTKTESAAFRYAQPETENHVFNAPRRVAENTKPTGSYQFYDTDGTLATKFIVFPIDGSAKTSSGMGAGENDLGVVTAVEDLTANEATREVVDVRYYNLMGVSSSKPFDGINIVVTTYSDGSRTSTKVLR